MVSHFTENFNSILGRGRQKNFLLASRLWVSRRKEPILGYVSKINEKKNLVHKGLFQVISKLTWRLKRYNWFAADGT